MNGPVKIPDLPHSIECEQALLGAVMLNNEAFHRVSEIVKAEHFYEEIHRRIFDAAERLIGDGRTASPSTIKAFVADFTLGEEMTCHQYLARLCAEAVAIITAPDYAQTIFDLAMRRKLIETATNFIDRSYTAQAGEKPSAIASEMVSELDGIASLGIPRSMRRISIGESARDAFVACVDAKEGKPSRGLKTGLSDLDAMIGGLERGAGSVVAGRPSMGKTALALEIARNVAVSGKAVFYISLEMGSLLLAQRALASVVFDNGAAVQYTRIATGRVSANEVDRIEYAYSVLDRLPFIIEQQTGLSVSQIAARVRRAITYHKDRDLDLALVVVDHIGLVGASSRYRGDRVREIGEISAGLHSVARETDTHVMMLSQLSRECEKRPDKRPMLSDLRESGEIEQNADVVMSAYRDSYYLERMGNRTLEQEMELDRVKNVLEVSVLKQRQGATGTVRLFADLASNAVRNLSA